MYAFMYVASPPLENNPLVHDHLIGERPHFALAAWAVPGAWAKVHVDGPSRAVAHVSRGLRGHHDASAGYRTAAPRSNEAPV